jgi:hypothetical protein
MVTLNKINEDTSAVKQARVHAIASPTKVAPLPALPSEGKQGWYLVSMEVPVLQAASEGAQVAACLADTEARFDCADWLCETTGLRTNGTGIPNQRDKKIHQNLIKAGGMCPVRQAGAAPFPNR